MRAEWVYPQELKSLIADLRKKDQLNTSSLDRLNTFISGQLYIYGVLIVFFMFWVIFFINSIWGVFFLCALITPVRFYYEIVKKIALYPVLYSKEKVLGECVNFSIIYRSRVRIPVYWRLNYKFNHDQKDYLGTLKLPIKGNNIRAYEKDKVTIFFDPEKPELNLLFVPSLYAIYNLKK